MRGGGGQVWGRYGAGTPVCCNESAAAGWWVRADGRARRRGGAAPGGQRNEEKGSALALPSSASLRCTDSYSSRAFAISVWAPATEARRIDFWLRTTVPRHALSVT